MPKTVKNRLHLDLISDTLRRETGRLLNLGAHRVRDVQAGKSRWTTFADVAGNGFDLIAQWRPGHGWPRRSTGR